MSVNNITSTDTMVSDEKFVLILLGMTLLSLLTIIGNIFVLVAYFTTPCLQTTTNLFIISLAISDLCVGFISINFMTVYLLHRRWPMGHVACDMLLSVDYSICQSSGLNLVAIAFDRMLKVRYPMYKLKKSSAKLYIMLMWLASFVFWFAANFGYHAVNPEAVPKYKCYIPFLYTDKYLTISTAVIHFYLPAVVILIVYLIITFRLIEQHKKVKLLKVNVVPLNSVSGGKLTTKAYTGSKNHLNVKPSHIANSNDEVSTCSSSYPTLEKNNKRESRINTTHRATRKMLAHRRAITLLSIVMIAYIITYLPYSVFTIITAYCPSCIIDYVWEFGYVFCYVNSLMNPFCYALGNRKYRRSFQRILKKMKTTVFIAM